MRFFKLTVHAAVILVTSITSGHAQDSSPITVIGGSHVATLHAQGAQVYECKVNSSNKLVWHFREPIATLFENGKTVGRHYAGPHWELIDGSVLAAKVVAQAPSATPHDIPLLTLEVTEGSGGRFADVTTIQRINTQGGYAEGSCLKAGALLSVPYSADYTFYRSSGTAPQAQ